MFGFSPEDFRDLASGRKRGLSAAALRGLLSGVEPVMKLLVARRNRQFDSRQREVISAGVPVISVGNLTLGGTGKTPVIAWLARWLRAEGWRVAILSRGYGAKDGSRNDEALELEERLNDVPHLQNPDRVASARIAVEELECQVLLLDDGFQHRRLARDLDIVLVDATCPFGYGRLFPRGMLREPKHALARADVIGISRANLVTPVQLQELRQEIRRYAPRALLLDLIHAPNALLSSDGSERPAALLRGQPVAAFCGIGNAQAFKQTLESCGAEVADFKEFPDHHDYSRADIEGLIAWARASAAQTCICTHKDLVKIRLPDFAGKAVHALLIGVEWLSGQEQLETMLRERIQSPDTLP